MEQKRMRQSGQVGESTMHDLCYPLALQCDCFGLPRGYGAYSCIALEFDDRQGLQIFHTAIRAVMAGACEDCRDLSRCAGGSVCGGTAVRAPL